MSPDRRSRLAADDSALRPTVYQPGLFAGKAVMVSAAGMGSAAAVLHARLGAQLVVFGADTAELEACAGRVRRLGGPEPLLQPLGGGGAEEVERLMDAAWARFGPMAALINSAAAHPPQRALDYSPAGWRAVIDSDLNRTWYLMHAMARRWRDGDIPGAIVNIVAAFQRGIPGLAHSCAASSAIAYLTKTVAVEWAPYRIRVNCLAHGTIAGSGAQAPPANGGWAGANPMKRPGDAHDVAEAAVYFTAPSGDFVTGELHTVDGGSVLWGETWAGPKPDYYRLNP